MLVTKRTKMLKGLPSSPGPCPRASLALESPWGYHQQAHHPSSLGTLGLGCPSRHLTLHTGALEFGCPLCSAQVTDEAAP